MAGDSQATFSKSVEAKIRDTYDYRCVICLNFVQTSQCAHIIDVATAGNQQLRNAVRLGVLPANYEMNAEMNGLVQCPSCHSYFTANYVVLSLPIPILLYLQRYVARTPKAERRPLHEVFDLLVDASHGLEVKLPDAEAIFPYLGLFTMVNLKPIEGSIATLYLPCISIISGRTFVVAPSNTSPSAEKAARIFDPSTINKDTPVNLGIIPLSPQDQANETRYWRLPVSTAAIFAALIERLAYDSFESEDIILASSIRDILNLQSHNYYLPDEDAEGSEPSAGSGPSGGGGRGGRRGGAGGSKRKNTGGKSSPSSGKGKKKARKVSGVGDGTGDCGEPSEASARSQSGHSHHQEITSSSRNLEDEALVQLIDAGSDNSDLGSGRSISAISPHDEDNPDQWRFGPSFSTNKIIFTARAVNLT